MYFTGVIAVHNTVYGHSMFIFCMISSLKIVLYSLLRGQLRKIFHIFQWHQYERLIMEFRTQKSKHTKAPVAKQCLARSWKLTLHCSYENGAAQRFWTSNCHTFCSISGSPTCCDQGLNILALTYRTFYHGINKAVIHVPSIHVHFQASLHDSLGKHTPHTSLNFHVINFHSLTLEHSNKTPTHRLDII